MAYNLYNDIVSEALNEPETDFGGFRVFLLQTANETQFLASIVCLFPHQCCVPVLFS